MTNMTSINPVGLLVGRILLAAIFIVSGWGKATGFAATAAMIGSKGLPMPEVLTALSILIELGGGLLIVVGWNARIAALAIAAFLVPVTLSFHAPWAAAPAEVQMQTINFMKNMSILGGMLLLAVVGPGRFALGRESKSL